MEKILKEALGHHVLKLWDKELWNNNNYSSSSLFEMFHSCSSIFYLVSSCWLETYSIYRHIYWRFLKLFIIMWQVSTTITTISILGPDSNCLIIRPLDLLPFSLSQTTCKLNADHRPYSKAA